MKQKERDQTDSTTDRATRDAAQALALKVSESDIYKEFEAASTAFSDDAALQKRYRDYQGAQKENQLLTSWSGRDKGFEDRMQRLEAELLENPKYKRYLAAQEELLVTIKDLNDYLTEKLGFDFADLTKPVGGCC